jgi:hypothetical protein
LPELRLTHFNVTRKRLGFRARAGAFASSRLRRLFHRRGDSTRAHNCAISMINMCGKIQIDPLMRRVHSDRQEPRHECTIIDYWSHARRMLSATISCYDCDCCGHRVQRPRLRRVVDVARSRSRILSRWNDRSTGVWGGCPRGRWELWLPLGRELLIGTGESTGGGHAAKLVAKIGRRCYEFRQEVSKESP